MLAAIFRLVAIGLAGADDAAGAPGSVVAEFSLASSDGASVHLQAEDPARKLTVLAFTASECPIARLYAPRLARYEKKYRAQGVRFLGIDPNLQDSPAKVKQFAKDAELEFPILLDPLQVVTDRLGVKRTTEVFLLDAEFRIVYRGAIDDQYSVGAQRPQPTNDYLVDAIESELAGETIGSTTTEPAGCLVGRVQGESAGAALTFYKDVAPILNAHCVECHRPGQIGPMSLLDYDDAKGWAPQVAEVVGTERMPPWNADPRFGHFKNDRRLTDTDQQTLVRWATGGATAGDRKDAPPAPVFADPEWLIGKPDLVVELPEDEQIPAEGVVPYRYVVVDPKLDVDHWVQAIEVKPGNRAVTHHVIAFLLPEHMTPNQVLNDPEGAIGGLHFAGNAPGGRPIQLPDGYGKFLAKGTRFLFQLHYTPNGKSTTDRTRMAIRFARAPVAHEVRTRAIVNVFGLNIPPNDPSATFNAHYTFSEPVRVTALMPHMHLRGKSFRFELERKDGARSILLDVPKYDFNWQHTYALEQPLDVQAGDTMHVTAVYDNSKDNPANPNPNQRVRWGDQTFQEMLVGYFGFEKDVAQAPKERAGSN